MKNHEKGKVYVAMMTMGSSLLMAGCSTLCGTFLMAFGQSEISWIFFMTFVGIVVLGVTEFNITSRDSFFGWAFIQSGKTEFSSYAIHQRAGREIYI